MSNAAAPYHSTIATQTLPTPKVAVCLPLEFASEDQKDKYCYHGGKCRCDGCEQARRKQMDDMQKNLDAFMPDDRLQLKPAIRQVEAKVYSMPAKRISPEFARRLIGHHEMSRERSPLYYLPDMYYVRDAYKLPGPNHKATQTEIRIGLYGIDGCPCVDKSRCWDL